jgi:hypothetical protein
MGIVLHYQENEPVAAAFIGLKQGRYRLIFMPVLRMGATRS